MKIHFKLILTAFFLIYLSGCGGGSDIEVEVEDGTSITSENLYIVENIQDPTSSILAREYAQLRQIPLENIIKVDLPVKIQVSPEEAENLTQIISLATKAKGFALAWSMPYRVGNHQSITSFVTNGPTNNAKFENSTCTFTQSSTYYNSGPSIGTPTSFNISTLKPSILMASYTSMNDKGHISPTDLKSEKEINDYLQGIRRTIKLGLDSEYQYYSGTAYYLKTTDGIRSVRSFDQESTVEHYKDYFKAQFLNGNTLGGKKDILIYQTGLANLDPSEKNTNLYFPGAIADSLTSYSGRLYDSADQISALSFLKAGATASYGTVREPCNFTQKFPEARILQGHYLSGDSIVEAYQKSVAWPTEGLFIGEPLARPFSRITAQELEGSIFLKSIGAIDGYYDIFYNNKLIASDILLKQKDEAPTNIGKIQWEASHRLNVVLKKKI